MLSCSVEVCRFLRRSVFDPLIFSICVYSINCQLYSSLLLTAFYLQLVLRSWDTMFYFVPVVSHVLHMTSIWISKWHCQISHSDGQQRHTANFLQELLLLRYNFLYFTEKQWLNKFELENAIYYIKHRMSLLIYLAIFYLCWSSGVIFHIRQMVKTFSTDH